MAETNMVVQQVLSENPSAPAALASDPEQPQASTLLADAATSASVAEAGVPAAATAADQPPVENGAELETGSASLMHKWEPGLQIKHCCQFPCG